MKGMHLGRLWRAPRINSNNLKYTMLGRMFFESRYVVLLAKTWYFRVFLLLLWTGDNGNTRATSLAEMFLEVCHQLGREKLRRCEHNCVVEFDQDVVGQNKEQVHPQLQTSKAPKVSLQENWDKFDETNFAFSWAVYNSNFTSLGLW